jgi:glycosyltransferase involved in cell wall biosynthesis
LRALVTLRAQAVRVDLDLFGPSRDEVATSLDGETSLLDELGDAVRFHGRIPQDQVPTRLSGVDFTVILRPTARYSEAGFPTKLVESLASGVPVITTPTSDIATFVKHGNEGILLDGHSSAAVARGIHEILRMPRAGWLRMGRAARQRALGAFDYHNYVDTLGHFLSEGRRTSTSFGAARLAD